MNIDRLAKLAGLPTGGRGRLNEASNRTFHEDPNLESEKEFRWGKNQLAESEDLELDGIPSEEMDTEEIDYSAADSLGAIDSMGAVEDTSDEDTVDMGGDEEVEVDEAELVQEVRRAKAALEKVLSEAKDQKEKEKKLAQKKKAEEKARAENKSKNLSETALKRVVTEEIGKIMKEFNLSDGWMYGDNKPKNSRQGQVITQFNGIGFGKR